MFVTFFFKLIFRFGFHVHLLLILYPRLIVDFLWKVIGLYNRGIPSLKFDLMKTQFVLEWLIRLLALEIPHPFYCRDSINRALMIICQESEHCNTLVGMYTIHVNCLLPYKITSTLAVSTSPISQFTYQLKISIFFFNLTTLWIWCEDIWW